MNIGSIFSSATTFIVNSIIPLIFALAVVLFVWGVIKFFIINADEEAKRSQGKQFMIWGIITLAVITSVWGLVRLVGGTFGFSGYTSTLPGIGPTNASIVPPTPPRSGGGGPGGGPTCPPPSSSDECPINNSCPSDPNQPDNTLCVCGMCVSPI